jgi:hypothetical protein
MKLETGFRKEGATAEERWKSLSPLSQLEMRERKRDGLVAVDFQWAEI